MRTTIEERAKAFCEKNICVDCGDRKNCDRGCVGCCIPTFSALEWLIQFGKSEHTGLTRWHDPKEELPKYVEVVEVKYKAFGKIMMAVAWRLGCLDSCEDAWYIDGTNRRIDPEAIIGWREIHEQDGAMTPKELYDWAVENDCEDYDIMVCQDKARIWEVVDCADVSVDTLSQTVDLKLNR